MSGEEGENLGHPVAHTPGENAENSERAAKIGATKAATEAAMAGLAQALAPEAEPEQQSLLLADPDEEMTLFGGPVKHVASILGDHRRARGRPKGSQNRASKDLAEYLLRMGFSDPALNLAKLANADPVTLAAELSEPYLSKGQWLEGSMTPGDALKLIKDANAELLPYFHAKRPQQVELPAGQQMGVMIIGQMNINQAEESKTIDITRFDAPDE
ncbi:hypothetical protein [Rhizobium rhizogenes]|uniref:hypothetical protein n=1 Tax=Rhizobium rhizogenes TaxID=359 RepID=UPI0015739614|nr:hypothetical protein [Rhizobium rhizogenes]NTF67700.1 hypothetical protein [Rhizobium rhizogenes]